MCVCVCVCVCVCLVARLVFIFDFKQFTYLIQMFGCQEVWYSYCKDPSVFSNRLVKQDPGLSAKTEAHLMPVMFKDLWAVKAVLVLERHKHTRYFYLRFTAKVCVSCLYSGLIQMLQAQYFFDNEQLTYLKIGKQVYVYDRNDLSHCINS